MRTIITLKKSIALIVMLFLAACGNRNKTQEEIKKDWMVFETKDY